MRTATTRTRQPIETAFTLKIDLPDVAFLQQLKADGVPLFPDLLKSAHVEATNTQLWLVYTYQRLKKNGEPYTTAFYDRRSLARGKAGLDILRKLLATEAEDDLAIFLQLFPAPEPQVRRRSR